MEKGRKGREEENRGSVKEEKEKETCSVSSNRVGDMLDVNGVERFTLGHFFDENLFF